MKKKIFLLGVLLTLLLSITGCDEKDSLKGSKITTTIYPLEYITNRLYNYESKVVSIYPNDTNVSTYKLSDKKLKEYAKGSNIFIYDGISDEKNIARDMIKINKKLNILDASYGMKYKYGIEELWLSPNNYLTLANTIKTNLQELSTSTYAKETIDKNYKSLEEDLSLMDVELRQIGKSGATLIVDYDALAFLKEYGFNVINISKEEYLTNSIKNSFKNQTYKYILVNDKDNLPDHIKDIVDNYGTTVIEVNTLETLTDAERANNDTYLTIMKDFINNIKDII